jgi:hypothetical protein
MIHYKEALELFELADKNNTEIYIDDVFCHKNEYLEIKNTLKTSEIESIDFSWKKY